MDLPDWAPEGVHIDQPTIARIYDYVLGGSHNFAADREMAHKVIAAVPDMPLQAQANRAFLHRAVRYLVAAGVRQFLDIGSGIPTLGNVHETAQRAAPDTRVVYVDIDPIAVAHSRQILAVNDRACVIQEDLRQPERILGHPNVRALLDCDQPIALLLVAILHVIPDDDDPADIVKRLSDALVPGSYLAIAHSAKEGRPEAVAALTRLSRETTTPMTPRSHAQIAGFFTGFDLVEPGVVWAPQWHPDSPDDVQAPERSVIYVGVGRKN